MEGNPRLMGEAESKEASGGASGFEDQENEWASGNPRTNFGDSGSVPPGQRRSGHVATATRKEERKKGDSGGRKGTACVHPEREREY